MATPVLQPRRMQFFQSTQVGKTKALGRPRDNLHSAAAVRSGWFRGGRRITVAGAGGRH